MSIADRWLLPDGIEEVLPHQAQQVEQMRRRILDLYRSWGYDLVIPPHIEYLESLQAGAGHDLDLMTFKVTDQMTGRMMGLRADTTPAVARIDAHALRREGPVRLCYAGSVFHTRPAYLTASRSPIQVGAELYGHAGSASDIEVISLMLETLAAAGVDDGHLDIGHVGIYRALVAAAGLSDEVASALSEAMQRKARLELETLIQAEVKDPALAQMLLALQNLSGDAAILEQASEQFAGAPAAVQEALASLKVVARELAALFPEQRIYFDLSELRGYNYHTGIVFSVYRAGQGQAIAQGGRYDGIGRVFGRARPATGFSTDLKNLLQLTSESIEPELAIYAPEGSDRNAIAVLRQNGEKVIQALPGSQEDPQAMGCDRILCLQDGQWQVEHLKQA